LGRISGHSNFSISAQDGVSVALLHPRQQFAGDLSGRRRDGFDVAQLELGHAAAGGMQHFGLDAVLRQDRARGGADVGGVEVHEASGVEHGLALAVGGRGGVELGALAQGASLEGFAGLQRQARAVMNARDLLERLACRDIALVGRPVGERGDERAEPARRVGVRKLALDEADAVLARLHRAMAQHQVRKVERPFVRRHVGALGHEAHVAERAGLLDFGVLLFRHAIELAGRTVVDQVEQPRKGVA
jgi:hypothetical protein